MLPVVARGIRREIMRKKLTLVLGALAIVLMTSEFASAQEFCIHTEFSGGVFRNFSARFMSAVQPIGTSGSSALMAVTLGGSVNAIGFGSFNFNPVFLADITLAWSIIADGVTENYDCRLFVPQLSGGGNQLVIRNVGNTRNVMSNCLIKPLPC
jgi:hypothetical protein